jgi:hypothetical protein
MWSTSGHLFLKNPKLRPPAQHLPPPRLFFTVRVKAGETSFDFRGGLGRAPAQRGAFGPYNEHIRITGERGQVFYQSIVDAQVC